MIDSNQVNFSTSAARAGKLGLALSGGGFRAALFHVGVLARLAEQDLLRYVSVISTVSGGSIIGAYYYLKVKQLLEGRRGDGLHPSADSYCLLVREIEREFVVALQHNLRLMTFADSIQNARMLSEKYSSTMRMADLFDEIFYAPITNGANSLLNDLPINPVFDVGSSRECAFNVPRLVLNATALNTGHLFQFSSDFVGEPCLSSVVGGTSAMPLLGRLSLEDSALEPAQRRRLAGISIGDAVAASCCVPGLLDPFSLDGLYRDNGGEEVVVRLVDGGVFDNQGVVSLYEDGCTHFICSDASDLLKWQAHPDLSIHNVAMRANDIMMDRIRNEVIEELTSRETENYVLFTLGDQAGTGYFFEDTQLIKALSAIRTDLDAFTDLEACALMYYGFRLSADKLGVAAANTSTTWGFSQIEPLADDIEGRQRLLRVLEVGSRQFMKVFYLGSPVPYMIVVVPLLVPIALFALIIYFLPPVPVEAWVVLGFVALVGVALSQNARIVEKLDQFPAFMRFRRRLAVAMKPLGVTMMLGMLGAGFSRVNLRIFNPLFLKFGKLDR